MSDIRLFRVSEQVVSEIKATASNLEKRLQTLIETNLERLLAVRFLATEYSTGKTHAGRIDTLGLDENGCPIILEYKRSTGENVISQGLFYLDWLMDHQAEFQLLAQKRLGQDAANSIDWTSPRLVCVAADFTKYDVHAVQQIDRNIDLIRYRRFGNDLMLLELVHGVTTESSASSTPTRLSKPAKTKEDARTDDDPMWLKTLPRKFVEIIEAIDIHVRTLGDDVQRKNLKCYIGYKRLRNFATVVANTKAVLLFLHLDPMVVKMEAGFTRDVTEIGHWGTGDLEVTLSSLADFEKAKPYLQQAYDGGP